MGFDDFATWLKDHAWMNWLIAMYAAIVASWNAWNTWRRDVSRFKFKLTYPPSYKTDEDIVVTVIYKGGPSVKVTKVRARVVKMEGLRWFERTPANGVDAILRPENREVPVLVDPEYVEHFWYIDVFTDGGKKRRKYLRRVPKFWVKEVDLGLISQDKVGGVAIPGALEKSLKAVVKAAKKDQKAKAGKRP
jgi:hypothetical protein